MLRAKTLASVFWSFAETWGEQTITFVLLVVLARLLDPSAFGIVALAGLAVYVAQDLIRVTVNQTLVQMEEVDDRHFSTVFWVLVIFSSSVAVTLSVFAGSIAAFFGEPLLARIVPVLSILLLINSCEIVQEARLVRVLNFRPLAIRSFTASLIGGAVSITMAFHGYGVWSIVVQQLVSATIMLVITTCYTRWLPSPVMSLRHFRDVAHLGRYITGMGIIEHLYTRLDILFLGWFLGVQAVGLYNAGFRILKMLLNSISGALSRALLPALSRLQNDPERLREAFLRCLRLSSTVTMPVFVGLACVGYEAVFVLLGPKWLDAVPVVTLLALAGAMQSFGLLTATTLTAFGRVRSLFFLTLAYACAYGVAVLIGVQWGIVGVAVAFVVTIYVMDAVQAWLLCRHLGIPIPTLLRNMAPMATATAVMATAILLLKQVLILQSYVALPAYVGLGAVIYATIIATIAPALRADIGELVGEMFRRRPSSVGG